MKKVLKYLGSQLCLDTTFYTRYNNTQMVPVTVTEFRKTKIASPPLFSKNEWWIGSLMLPMIENTIECGDKVPDVSNSSKEKGWSVSPLRKNLAIFVSGGGSNFRSIHNASANGLIHGDVVVLVTDKLGCGGADYARDHDIPVIQFPKLRDSLEGLSPTDLVHYILLAGFLKLIPIELIQAYPRSILNIHPSLLPAFGGKGYYGIKVHKAVIASGAR
ncbi:hypothetical protein KSP40_PGU015308 [Platanthera guangdongensis]|uniref:phosphoribosylglycinamide formyltransferase 1 n=1 Tax=Platanthera guangdongensis TaxID=2320717 RepID=A0ABR2MJM7_9ASPA